MKLVPILLLFHTEFQSSSHRAPLASSFSSSVRHAPYEPAAQSTENRHSLSREGWLRGYMQHCAAYTYLYLKITGNTARAYPSAAGNSLNPTAPSLSPPPHSCTFAHSLHLFLSLCWHWAAGIVVMACQQVLWKDVCVGDICKVVLHSSAALLSHSAFTILQSSPTLLRIALTLLRTALTLCCTALTLCCTALPVCCTH